MRLTAGQIDELLKENFFLELTAGGSALTAGASAVTGSDTDLAAAGTQMTDTELRGRVLLQYAGPAHLEGTFFVIKQCYSAG